MTNSCYIHPKKLCKFQSCYNLTRKDHIKNKNCYSLDMTVALITEKQRCSILQYICKWVDWGLFAITGNGSFEIHPAFSIKGLQDLYGQFKHFQFFMRSLRRAKEQAFRIPVSTSCQSWLTQYGKPFSPYFNERELSVWKTWKCPRLQTFPLKFKMPFIISDEYPFRYL